MKRKSTSQVTGIADPMVIGLDVGFGRVKAIATEREGVSFPSVWGTAQEVKFQGEDLSTRYPGDMLSDSYGDWFVGDLATRHLLTPNQRRLRGRTADEASQGNIARIRLLKVAAGKLFSGLNGETISATLATGLPVDHMYGAGDYKAALLGDHEVHTNATHFTLRVDKVMVMPQPYGTIYTEFLTRYGAVNPAYRYARTGVVDIGTYTTDITVDENGEYLNPLSGSVEAGVHIVHQWLGEAYERDFGKKLSVRQIEAIMETGVFLARDKQVDYSGELAIGVGRLRDAVLNLLGDLWQNASDIEHIIISGGGARLVGRAIQDIYPHAIMAEDIDFANAIGFSYFATYKLSGGQ